MLKIKKLLSKSYNNFNNIEEIKEKINKMSFDFTYLNEKYEKLNNEVILLKNELIASNQINEVMFKDIQKESKYSNFEMLTLDSNIKQKKVLLVGFYGAPNLGDELMLEVFVEKLKNVDNIHLTVMLSENKEFDITNYQSFSIIHYPKSILDINVLANYFDVVIFGGGALLDDSDYDNCNNYLSLSNTLINLTTRMIQFNKKTILYGLSTSSSFTNEKYLNKLNFIINNCTYFSLRDTNSLNTLIKCKVNVSKIKIVDDVVFCLERKNSLVKKKSSFITIGIDFICKNEDFELLKNCVKWLVEYLTENSLKYKIVLIPFYEYQQNDSLFYNKIKNELKNDNIFILDYLYGFESVKKEFIKIDYMINMRYHGSLLSYLFSIPSLNIIFDVHNHYVNKMDYLINNYNFNTCTINFSLLNKNEFLNGVHKLFNKIYVSYDPIITKRANSQLNTMISEVFDEKK